MYSSIVNYPCPKRHSYRALGLAALLGLAPTVALAAPLQGQWQGVIQQANADVAVHVSFNGQGADIHFNDPLSCTVPATFLKQDGTRFIYRFAISRNGGQFCDRLMSRELDLTQISPNKLTIAFNSGRANWTGGLSASGRP